MLGFAQYGAADGPAVLFFHGEVGSRLLARTLDPAARRLGMRIVSPERPGLGFSDFRPGRTISDWPADVVELTEQLGIERFAVVGAAAGAPYALACARQIPDRLTSTLLAGAVLPVSMTEHPPGTPLFQRVLSDSAVRAPWTIRVAMTLLGGLSRRAPEQAVRRMADSAGDADREVFARPEIRAMLGQSIAESFRSGAHGAAHDLRLTTADWGLPFGEISAVIGMWHGDADLEVPPDAARRLAAALPHCDLHLVPGAGHHLALAQPDVLLDALSSQS